MPLLEAVGLQPFRHAFPAELSLGMARRAALARAVAVEPDLLALDEPFVSLDQPTADRLQALLVELWRARPMTVLMVTHNLREAVRLADRLLVLSPRPARLIAALDVPLAREKRHGPALDALVRELAARFSGLATEGS
jgi:NitT/TauT family transport system ATP-binding protein